MIADACIVDAHAGLGIMGDGMARRLLTAADRNLVVWNRSPEKCNTLLTEAGNERVTVVESAAAGATCYL